MNSDPSGHQCRTEISSGCLDPGAMLLGESAWEEAYKMSDEEKEIAGNGILSASMGMASLLRFHPIGGAAIGGIELFTGKRWGSEDGLSGGDKFFATAGVVLPFADRGLGIVNKTVQSARVARYEHGAELLRATSIDEVQSLALKANPKITFSRYVDRNTLASYSRGGSDPLIGKEFAIGNRGGVEILKHEVVHALQDVNGFFKGLAPRPRGRDYWEAISSNRSFFSDSGRLKSTVRIFDSEVMAYATTENHRTLSTQLLHSLSSTKSYAPSLSKTAIQAERFVDKAQSFGGHAIRGVGAAMSMGAD